MSAPYDLLVRLRTQVATKRQDALEQLAKGPEHRLMDELVGQAKAYRQAIELIQQTIKDLNGGIDE